MVDERKCPRCPATGGTRHGGGTIKKVVQRCIIRSSTAFRWRHQFLEGFVTDKTAALSGMVEADEAFFLDSYKNQQNPLPGPVHERSGKIAKPGLSAEPIPVLITCDHNRKVFNLIIEKVDAKQLDAALNKIMTN